MNRLLKRIRWNIAYLLNRLPNQCWPELVSWALDGASVSRHRVDTPLPWRTTNEDCRLSAQNCGTCWCAKIRPAAQASQETTDA